MDDQARTGGEGSPENTEDHFIQERPAGELAESIPSVVLDAHRTYLIKVAADLLSPELRAKVSASDLVQESMIVAVTKYESFRGKSPEELRSWLEGILRNKYLDAMRKFYRSGKSAIGKEISIEFVRGDESKWDLPDRDGSSEELRLELLEMHDFIRAESEKLPAMDRTLIERKLAGNQSVSEIAEELGISPESAHKKYQRAIKKLQERFDAKFGKLD